MADLHTFKIHAPITASGTSIEIDGTPMEGVTRVEFSLSACGVTEIKLTLIGYVDISGEFREGDILRVQRERGVPQGRSDETVHFGLDRHG